MNDYGDLAYLYPHQWDWKYGFQFFPVKTFEGRLFARLITGSKGWKLIKI